MELGLFWLVGFLVHILSVSAKTLNYEWNITWVLANPDGLQERPVIGINGQWPLPVLNLTLGDRVIAKVYNALGNESTSIHWHGFFQNGTTHMDGAPSVNQTGTYWYHSHARGQYPDGLRQALVIRGPDEPYSGQYDEERVITLSEWYHDPMPTLLKQFISVTNPTGAEPVPKSALMNDTQNLTIAVEPGKTYLFRLVNVAAFASQYFWIEDHTMKIVEVDGVWTEPAEASMIYITAAQRYSFLVTMKNDTNKNYAIVGSMDTRPAPTDISSFDPYDDFKLVPVDGERLLGDPDYTVTLDLTMDNLGDVPTLYTALSTGSAATNSTVYGYNTNAFILDKGDVIDLVLNNDDTGKHPFHLHGHNFQVVARSDEDAGHYDANNHSAFPSVPMRRDTIYVKPTGYFVIRFRADNPGDSRFLFRFAHW
ncbi:unnamed protein product [Aspergillus oryzae var. brunneus]|uniref:Unnamed protein product n=1 Tax=Aspergillus oryzae var. brunneus TaxID=332754 RepID=A0ABQ6LCU7_ASPOZ|nr:unnamed protein product [Aspergillus oryzae]GMG54315.1 unnamed protein product [Aspergillus oryzae var. brunneus]